MKYVPAVLALVTLAAEAVPPMAPVSMPPQQRPQQDLRQSLQQVQISAPSPRQLSPVERAELRRQLIEYDRQPPPARRVLAQP